MLYKPQYCCQCGEKIDRAAWHFWTSRKFCEICETELPGQRWMPFVLIATSFVSVIFGFGAYLKTGERLTPSESNQNLAIAAGKNSGDHKKAQLSGANAVQNNAASQNAPLQSAPSAAGTSADPSRAKNLRLVKGENPQTAAEKAVYYCGAQTKKGTPCTRRVKAANERCWQHEGLPALPPAQKRAAAQ